MYIHISMHIVIDKDYTSYIRIQYNPSVMQIKCKYKMNFSHKHIYVFFK